MAAIALCVWFPVNLKAAPPSTWWWDGATQPAPTGASLNVTTNVQNWLGDGYWDNGSSVEALIGWNDGDSAIFGGTASSQTIGADGITIGNMTFGEGPQGAGNSGTAYTLSGGTITLSANTGITNNTDTVISALLAGSGSLTKWGTSALTLTAENPYTGGTTVNAGTLCAWAGNTPTGAIGGGDVTVNNGGTISVGNDNSFVGGSHAPSSVITINAGGLIISTNGATCHLQPMVLDGGILNATIENDVYGNWNFDYGVSTPGDGSSSFILGGNATLTQGGGSVFDIGANDTLTVSTALQDTYNILSQGLIKTGDGTLTLTAANSYSGGTTVNSGTVFANAANSEIGAMGGDVAVNGGGTISVGGDNSLVGYLPSSYSAITINAGGLIISTNGAACHLEPLVLNGGTLSATIENASYGNWEFDYGVSTPGNGTSSFISGGNAGLTQVGGTVFNVGAGDTLMVSTVLAGSSSFTDQGLIESGGGTLTILATNTSTAQWMVAAGTLNGTGTIAAPVWVQPGGTLAAGTASSLGTLSLSGGLTLAGNVSLRINSITRTSDSLSQMAGFIYGGTLTVTDLGASLAKGETFTLFKLGGGAYGGGFTSFVLPALTPGLSWDLSQLTVNGSISVTNATGTPIFSPSPGTCLGAQTVTISSLTPGAIIYYTTNGSTPSATSLQGAAPVAVYVPENTTLTISAYAQVSGGLDSAVVAGTYTTVSEAIWTDTNGGNWLESDNWQHGLVGQGSGVTADFSQLTLSDDVSVTLNVPITVGQLIFGDVGNNYSWNVNPGAADTLTMDATNTPAITVSNQSATITVNIAGTDGLAKLGPGTLTLTGANTYSGGTTIDNGTISTSDFASLGSGPIQIGADGTNSFGTDGYNQPAFANAVSGSGAFNVWGSPGNQSFWSGDWSGFSGTLTLAAGDTGWWARSANTGGTAMQVNMIGGSPGCFLGLYDNESSITRTYNIGELTGGVGAVIFGQPNTADNITVSVGALDASTTFAGLIQDNWNGPTDASSTINLTKVGSGTLTLSGANTYTGATTVSSGTLQVDGAIASGAVAVQSGGTLDGAGVIAGPVMVNSGGTLNAGDLSGPGMLTISNALTLNPGSATMMRLNQAAATNDSVSGITMLTCGGTLTVTNLGGTLAAGNSFQLFNAATYAGSFSATNLPALGAGLAWNWLPTNGTLAVISTALPAPKITGFSHLADGWFSLTFSGSPGADYSVYATTNLALPISNWMVLTTGSFNGAPVPFQDTNATKYKARFYEVVLP